MYHLTFQPPIILASHYRPEKDPTKQVGLGRDPTFSAVRDALLKAVGGKEREKSPNLEAEKVNDKLLLADVGFGP